jgi:hypothetical protein
MGQFYCILCNANISNFTFMWPCIVTFMWPCIVTNFFVINKPDAIISQVYFGMKLYLFRTIPLSIIRSYSLYTQQWYMSYRQLSSSRIRMELHRSSILILLASCLQTSMTYTSAECTVNNSWWWTEELSETSRVSFQNKLERLVHLVGLLQSKYFGSFCIRLLPYLHILLLIVSALCITFCPLNLPILLLFSADTLTVTYTTYV